MRSNLEQPVRTGRPMRYKLVTGLVCLLSIVTGALYANLETEGTPLYTDDWSYDAPLPRETLTAQYQQMLEGIEKSNMFPKPEGFVEPPKANSDNNDPANNPDDPLYIPDFPEILSVAIVDGAGRLSLRGEENTAIYASEGDVLNSGWQVKAIDLTRVTVVFGAIERELTINYNTQNEARDANMPPKDL